METQLERHSSGRKRIVWWKLALVSGTVFLTFAVIGFMVGFYSLFNDLHNPDVAVIPSTTSDNGNINVLIMGLDANVQNGKVVKTDIRKSRQRSDTMILASINPARKQLVLISIPRDTRVVLPNSSHHEKINAAHVYGGPQLAMKAVSDLLGVPVPYYVRTDLEGFKKIVDILGGVEITIDKRMYYVDPYQDLKIDLQPGTQVLDGEKAMEFIRYRHYENGDIDRIKMQQRFLTALLKKLMRPQTIFKLPAIMGEIKYYVDTNLEPGQVLSLARSVLQMKSTDVKMAVLPGYTIEGSSDWIPNREGISRMVRDLLTGDKTQSSSVKVVVANGSGVAGQAGRLAEVLKEHGYQISGLTNAELREHTVIVNHSSSTNAAQEMAQQLKKIAGISVSITNQLMDDGPDLTIILGKDFPASRL